MLFGKFLISLLFVLVAQFCVYGSQKDYSYTIKGRVIDEYSKPVANASITIKSPEYDDGCIVYTYQTDKSGNFIIKRELERLIPEWTLYAVDSSPLPENTHRLLSVGYVFEDGYYKEFAGQKITVTENQTTDLGDVQLQVRHYPVLLQLLDSEGNPLIKESKNDDEYGFNSWWIIRDPRGDIISEGGNAYAHLRFSESAVMSALPEGDWHLDVFDDNGSGFEVSQTITVKKSTDVQKITLKFKKTADLKFEGRGKPLPYTPETARQKIERMGFDFTQDSFENRVLHGNDKAVALFLNAGMNADVLTKGEWFLRNSVNHPQVLKLLLEAGADVNRKIDEGWTPLMFATNSDVATVRMLLDAGANPKAKNAEGHDALYYSQINDDNPEITQLLKSYLAKKKLR